MRTHQAGKLQFVGEHAALVDATAFKAWLAPLRQCEWVVCAKRPFAGPQAVHAHSEPDVVAARAVVGWAASRALPLQAPDRARGVASAPASFVQVAYSSRHPTGVAPILDEALLHECEVPIDSLAFTQARQSCRPGPGVP